MPEFKKKLLLIDGHALFHRAFHALPNMTGPGGFPTGAIFGFLSMLFKALADIKPTHALVTFDMPGKTFRDTISTDYKATRKAAPDDLTIQLPKLKEILTALDFPIYEKSGYEADDLLGIIAHKTPKDVLNIIVTGDLDLLQLIDNHTQVYRFKIGFSDIQIFDTDKMIEIYGLHPSQWVDYKAIRGDTSDNIPGVPGIGEKGALELIKTFGSLDGVYEAVERMVSAPDAAVGAGKIKPGTLKKLEEGKVKAYMSQRLAHIDQSASAKATGGSAEASREGGKNIIDFDFEATKVGDYDQAKVIELLHAVGIRALTQRLPKLSKEAAAEVEIAAIKTSPVQIVDEDDMPTLMKSLAGKKTLAIYTDESGISVSLDGKKSFKFENPARIKSILEDEGVKKIGHNLKNEYTLLKQKGIELAGLFFDTQIAMYLADPGRREYLLDSNAAAGVFQLFESISKELEEKKLTKLFNEIEMPLVEVLIAIENRGVKLDLDWLADLSKQLGKRINQLIKEIHKQAGMEFNISSPKQLQEVLFEKLRIPTENLKKNKKSGGLSTAAGELEKLRGLHPIIELIFEYRELTKLKSTYIDALPVLVSKEDERLHTSYIQTISATGRLSSNNPNLQNIPIRTELGNEVRKSFIAEKGKVLLSLDYSQIELRIAASLSGDPEMIKIFKSGGDFHAATASRMFDVKESEVSGNMRRSAKTINFGILYGVSAFGLSSRTEMEHAEAAAYIKKYYETFPKLKQYIDSLVALAHKDGAITNPLGRVRYLPEIGAANFAVRSAAERQAVNMPMQSLAADIIKLAMLQIERGCPEVGMILTVHDELVFETDKDKAEESAKKIKPIMESVYKLKVPLLVEAKVGTNWSEMEKL